MGIHFTAHAWEDYLSWQKEDKKLLKKINELIKAIGREPFSGIGKPEPLKHDLAGFWSRRIDREHRLVYKIEGNTMFIISCRFHYD
jgi:toxin YoeB